MNAPVDENGYPPWQPQPQPQHSGLRYLWNHPVVIAGVMGMLLLLVTAISIIAIKAVGDDGPGGNTANPGDTRNDPDRADNTAGPVPTSGLQASTPPAQSPSTGGAPPVNSTNAVFLSGKMNVAYYDAGFDFDTAKESSLGDGEKYDLDPTETALTAVNRAQVGVGAAAGAPSAAGCQAAAVRWSTSAHVSVLTQGAVVCVKTSDDRLGAFTVTKLDKNDSGQIQFVEAEYVVWKKQGDQ